MTSDQSKGSGRHSGRPQRARRPSVAASNFSKMSRATRGGPLQMIQEDRFTDQFARMNVNKPSGQEHGVYDPSEAPSHSEMTVNTMPVSAAPFFASGFSFAGPVETPLCTLTRRNKNSFTAGEIITLPHHVANGNPEIDLQDKHLALTNVGGVYSKRRMFVILIIKKESMVCIPLLTFDHTGIRGKPISVRNEYVSMVNEDKESFENEFVQNPIKAKCRKPLDKDSTIHLGDIFKVGFREDTGKVGQVAKEAYDRLVYMWRDFVRWAFGGK